MNRFIETWPKISQLIIQKQIVYEYIFINKVHLIVTAHEKHNELQVFTGGERTIEGFNSISSKLLTSLCPTLPWPDDITHCSREILRKRLDISDTWIFGGWWIQNENYIKAILLYDTLLWN